jgi:hypothetical protein
MDPEALTFDEEAAIEAAQESAIAHPRDVLKREHERMLKGHPHDVALEKWGPELEEMMMWELLESKDLKYGE